MRRHELTDERCKLAEPLLPENGHRGGQWKAHRTILNGILWRVRTGVPWRELPERYGPWQTVYDRFNRWCTDGPWDRIAQALEIRLDEEGMVDWDLWCVDGTNVRATKAAAGGGKKGELQNPLTTGWGARAADGGANCTWSLTVEALPWPCTLPQDESTQFEEVIRAVPVPRGPGGVPIGPKQVSGDKGYSAGRIREWLKQRSIEGVIPHRDDERRSDPEGTSVFDKQTCRRRCVIECCIGWPKQCRAVATRYDKLALNYLATVQVPMIQRHLRMLAPASDRIAVGVSRAAALAGAG